MFVLLLVAAQLDPSEPPPPLDETPSRVELIDPLVRCRALINDDALERAEACLKETEETSGDADVRQRARAMREVVVAWRARPVPTPTTTTTTVSQTIEPAHDQLSLSSMIERGAAEGVVAGTIGGAVAGFTIGGAIFSTTRTPERDSLPWLVAIPALGAVAGAAGSYAWIEYVDPEPGDIALTWSTAMMGAAAGFNLQLAVFDGSPEVGTVPLRFLSVLGGGALGLGAGALLTDPMDATRGDVAVAHSAALWGGVLTTIGLYEASALGAQLEFSQGVLIGGAGVLLPYAVALAAHPVLAIDYWPAWLIDAGGAAGVLTSFAALVVLSSTGAVNNATGPAIIGAGTVSGLALGSVAAVAVTNSLAPAEGE